MKYIKNVFAILMGISVLSTGTTVAAQTAKTNTDSATDTSAPASKQIETPPSDATPPPNDDDTKPEEADTKPEEADTKPEEANSQPASATETVTVTPVTVGDKNTAAVTTKPIAPTSPEGATAPVDAKPSKSKSLKPKKTSKNVVVQKVNIPVVNAQTVAAPHAPERLTRHMFVVTYNMANPGGATAKFVDEFSFEGFGFEYRFLLKQNLSIGAAFGWNTFETKHSGLFELDKNITLQGTRIKTADLIQLTPSIHYYFNKKDAKVTPFFGVAIGPYYSTYTTNWGWWQHKETSWHFGFTPEFGVRITALPIPIYLATRFSYAFKSKSMDAQRTLGINIGIAFLK